jgi:methionyl-tRNA synthetase
MLNIQTLGWEKGGITNLIEAGHCLGQPQLLFDKIEDHTIDFQLAKLKATKEANNSQAIQVTPQKGSISYDDFSRMDIRTATVLSAERVPKTQKLLKLDIDTGIDKRTIVSGIAEFFSPEDMIGKQVVILANLEPRKIKGIESNGMILMAQDASGKLVLVQPSEKVSNGSEVK